MRSKRGRAGRASVYTSKYNFHLAAVVRRRCSCCSHACIVSILFLFLSLPALPPFRSDRRSFSTLSFCAVDHVSPRVYRIDCIFADKHCDATAKPKISQRMATERTREIWDFCCLANFFQYLQGLLRYAGWSLKSIQLADGQSVAWEFEFRNRRESMEPFAYIAINVYCIVIKLMSW